MRGVFTALLALLAASSALAQTTSSTRPADPTTPAGAMAAFVGAIDRGDLPAVRAAMYVSDDSQKELADAWANGLIAGKRLYDAMAKLDPAATQPTKGLRGRLNYDVIRRLPTEDWRTVGNRAMAAESGGGAFVLVAAGETWQIPMAAVGGAPKTPGKDRLFAAAIERVLPEIQAGKHKTLRDVREAIERACRDIEAASQPATRP